MQMISDADLARRRRASARLAWWAGAAALALYTLGFFVQR